MIKEDAGKLILISGGDHARVLLALLDDAGMADMVAGITDVDKTLHGKEIMGVKVLGDDSLLEEKSRDEYQLINGIGSTTDLAIRQKVYERFSSIGFQFPSIIHQTAIVSGSATIADGSQLLAGVIVNPFAKIGYNCIVNSGAVIEHDADIGNHVHIAPGVIMSGSVSIGSSTHVGTGAVILQGIKIGNGVLVAAGSVVTSHVQDGAKVKGVPAKPYSS